MSPTGEPWSAAEIVRAITNFSKTLERIETKLDSRPTREELTTFKDNQKRIDDTQDVAIKDVEGQLTRLLFLALSSLATGAGGVLVALVTR